MIYKLYSVGGELYHHGVPNQKWGVRNGPPYPLSSDKLALKIFREAKKREPRITKDVKEASKLSNSNMYGLEHRLKTLESIKRKIDTDAEEKGITVSKAAQDIKDAVRYTTLSYDDSFTDNYNTFKSSLEDNGYVEVRCRNYFDMYKQGKAKHKSVQSVFQDPKGYKFEVQFQTPSSQQAKDKKVPIYEERRKPGLSIERQMELERKMDKLAKGVKDPKGVFSIKSH